MYNSGEDAAEYVKSTFGIPFVNFENINLDVIEEIIKTLSEVFGLYPKLKPAVCAIAHQKMLLHIVIY